MQIKNTLHAEGQNGLFLRKKFSKLFNKYSDLLCHLEIDIPKFLRDNIPLKPDGYVYVS